MKRISIVGVSASGKSTLGKKLAKSVHAPFIELDALFWKPHWQQTEAEVFREKTTTEIQADRWIIDGNYFKVQPDIWAKADTIIWVQLPLWLNLWSVVRRTFMRMLTRESLWGINQESFFQQMGKDSVILWVWKTYRAYEQRYSESFRRMSQQPQSPRLVHLRNREQADIFMRSIERHPHHAVIEKVLLYPVRFAKNGEPELLVFRHPLTGLIEVMQTHVDIGEQAEAVAVREFRLQSGMTLQSPLHRFSTGSFFIKTKEEKIPEAAGRSDGLPTTPRARRFLRQASRIQYQYHQAYWTNLEPVPERFSVDLMGHHCTYFWMSLAKAAVTMTPNSKSFLKDLRDILEKTSSKPAFIAVQAQAIPAAPLVQPRPSSGGPGPTEADL